MLDINFSGVIDLFEEVSNVAPKLMPSVLKIFDELDSIKQQLGSFDILPFENINPRFALILKNKTVRHTIHETKKSWIDVNDVYDNEVTEKDIITLCDEIGQDYKNLAIDWSKLPKIVFKLFMLILPRLMTSKVPVPDLIPTDPEALRAFYIKNNTRLQNLPNVVHSKLEKQIYAATTNVVIQNPSTAILILKELQK